MQGGVWGKGVEKASMCRLWSGESVEAGCVEEIAKGQCECVWKVLESVSP